MTKRKKDQNVKFKKSAIDFKAIKSTNNPSLTSEDETIRSAAVNTKISHCRKTITLHVMEALTSSEILGEIIPTCRKQINRLNKQLGPC